MLRRVFVVEALDRQWLLHLLHLLLPNEMSNSKLTIHSARTPRCNFWEWLEDDEYQLQKNSDLGQIYNLTFKLGNLENEITYCRKKLEEEKNSDLVFRQELDKVKWKLFTHKAALFVLFFLYVKHAGNTTSSSLSLSSSSSASFTSS
uniref:Uncharacterized protein n=1 Tax=Lactuca sativa TaxID=4236 RepID=A0A9R1VV65_LACSA|nr:hypothetical protein LSAT_V11C400194820 [Lactuca sativa]